MNKKTRMSILLSCILLISLFTLIGCSGESNYDVEASIDIGYDSIIKVSSDNPLVATITNKGQAFKGDLRIEVEDGNNELIVLSQPFEIAENATKEIHMDIPIFTLQKKYKVYITVGDDKIYRDTIRMYDFISPDDTVMAVITDTPDSYRFLENVALYKNYDASVKYESYYYEETMAIDDSTRVFYFDSMDDFKSRESLEYFDYIYLGQIQNLNISEEVENYVMEWVEEGHMLVVETGASYQKVNNILPNVFKNYLITDSKKVQIDELWPSFPINNQIDLGIGEISTERDTELYTHNGNVIGASSRYHNGYVMTLCINMALEPMQSWSLKHTFLNDLLITVAFSNNYNGYNNSNSYRYELENLPIDKRPPYLFMFMLFLVYLIIVGPVGYFILKTLDKRDLAWVLIPGLALGFTAILYLFGFTTRYSKPIMNSISTVIFEEGKDTAQIDSHIGIFNNQNEGITIEWDDEQDIAINLNDWDNYYGYYDDDTNAKNITGMLTMGNERKFEKYGASLWSTTYIYGKQQLPMAADELVNVAIDGDNIEVNINNTMPFDLEDLFIIWNRNFIYVGDVLEGESKSITETINYDKVQDFYSFFNDNFGSTSYNYNRMSKEENENYRRREILSDRYDYYYYGEKSDPYAEFGEIIVCALNDNAIGYDLIVNGKEPEKYNINIIEIHTQVEFTSGSLISLNENTIKPQVIYMLDKEYTKVGEYYYDEYENNFTFFESGVAEFIYSIPKEIEVASMTLTMGDIYNEEDYYNMGGSGSSVPLRNVFYTIYNNDTEQFERANREMVIDIDKHINDAGEIVVQVEFFGKDNDYDYDYAKVMVGPKLSLEGRVK